MMNLNKSIKKELLRNKNYEKIIKDNYIRASNCDDSYKKLYLSNLAIFKSKKVANQETQKFYQKEIKNNTVTSELMDIYPSKEELNLDLISLKMKMKEQKNFIWRKLLVWLLNKYNLGLQIPDFYQEFKKEYKEVKDKNTIAEIATGNSYYQAMSWIKLIIKESLDLGDNYE